MDTTKLDQTFQSCLEKIVSGNMHLQEVLQEHPENAQELKPRLETALWLGEHLTDLQPRPGYIEASRLRLVARLPNEKKRKEPLPIWTNRHSSSRGLVLRFGTALVIVLALLANSLVIKAAAQVAYPGDPLYPVKRAEESLKLATAISSTRQAELLVVYTQRRASEVEELILEGRYEYVSQAALDFEQQLTLSLLMLEGIHISEPNQMEGLASDLAATLEGQALLMNVLVSMAPSNSRPGLQRTLTISQQGIDTIQSSLIDATPHPSFPISTPNS
jgi:hypothetical protein